MPFQVAWGRCHRCGLHRDVVDIPNRPDHWNYSLPFPICQECLADALKSFPLPHRPLKEAGESPKMAGDTKKEPEAPPEAR